MPYKDIEPIIGQLITEGYLNEARFAQHFAVSKARQKGWGSRKIGAALKQKQVSAPCIRAALKVIDQEEMDAQLKKLVAKRWEKEKEPKSFLKRQKVMAYFLRRGFSVEQIERALAQ